MHGGVPFARHSDFPTCDLHRLWPVQVGRSDDDDLCRGIFAHAPGLSAVRDSKWCERIPIEGSTIPKAPASH